MLFLILVCIKNNIFYFKKNGKKSIESKFLLSIIRNFNDTNVILFIYRLHSKRKLIILSEENMPYKIVEQYSTNTNYKKPQLAPFSQTTQTHMIQ